jgi:hypothetical protein
MKKLLNIFSKKSKPVPQKLPTDSEISKILDDIKNQRAYYAGGSLCVDGINEQTLVMNLDGRAFYFCENAENKQLETTNRDKLFEIYKEHKGETGHYLEMLAKYEGDK